MHINSVFKAFLASYLNLEVLAIKLINRPLQRISETPKKSNDYNYHI